MTEVLVVGAGPTGLVAAIQLLRFGVACRVVDRAAGPATTSRALGCHSRTLEALADVGVIDEVLRASRTLRGAIYYRGDRPIARMRWVPQDSPYPRPLVLAQAELEAILRARLAALGGTIEWGRGVADLSQEADGVTARLDDGSQTRTRWLIGCDGAHSRVREAAGIAFVGAPYPEVYYLGDLELDLRGDESQIWLGQSQMIAAMPLDDRGTWRVFADVTPVTPGERVPPPTVALFQQLLDTRAFKPGEVHVRGASWLSVFRLQRRQAARYRAGRVFVAGDAAHVFPPFGGQGMNTGIQDAYNLAWKLAAVLQGWGPADLLDTYDAERHPLGEEVIRRVDRTTRMFTGRGALAAMARELLLRALLPITAFRRAANRRSSGLAIHYRGLIWLSGHVGKGKGPRAGDRAPDGRLAGATLHARRDGLRWCLLLFPGTGAPADLGELGPRVQLLRADAGSDPDGALRRLYRAETGALVLIRPDGHVGFRGDAGDLAGLRRYLARALAGPAKVSRAGD